MTDPLASRALPLVSVGVPVYNGARVVQYAIESMLSQTYGNLEFIISDNASTDDTETICRRYQALDSRIRYFRQSRNIGVIDNFAFCLAQSAGEYFMWCAGDDRVSNNYVEACAAVLNEDAEAMLVGGSVDYVDSRSRRVAGSFTQILDDSPSLRVLKYFRRVSDNGVFYGLYRRRRLVDCRFRPILGGDWLWIAEVAYLGKIRTTREAQLTRDDSWANGTPEQYFARVVRALGLHPILERCPRTVTALSIGLTMVRRSAVFGTLRWPRRLLLGITVASLLLGRAILAAARQRVRRSKT